MQTLQKMLELDLMLLVISQKDHYRKEKNENVTGLIKPVLGGKIMIEFAALTSKTYSHLTDDRDELKYQKALKGV